MSSKSGMWRAAVGAVAVASALGCRHVTAGALDVRAPVLIGPLERTAQRAAPPQRREVARFEAKTEFSAMGGGGQTQGPPGYVGHVAVSANSSYDDVAYEVSKAWIGSGQHEGDVIRIEEARARVWFDNYVVMMSNGMRLAIEGAVMRPTGGRR